MTKRTTELFGTDWVDNEVLFAADLNDTIEEIVREALNQDDVDLLELAMALEEAKGYEEIGRVILDSTGAASVTFSNISTSFRVLHLIVRGDTMGSELRCQLNGVSGSNYNSRTLTAAGANATGQASWKMTDSGFDLFNAYIQGFTQSGGSGRATFTSYFATGGSGNGYTGDEVNNGIIGGITSVKLFRGDASNMQSTTIILRGIR